MDINRGQQLRDVIELSKDMLSKAQAGEWELVAGLEARRKALVAGCFEQPTSGQDAPEVAVAIREILSLNQQLTRLGEQCREQLGCDIHASKVGRNASEAYLGCAR
ncbi:MAG: flagellar protein FliT [Thiogranum sp.]